MTDGSGPIALAPHSCSAVARCCAALSSCASNSACSPPRLVRMVRRATRTATTTATASDDEQHRDGEPAAGQSTTPPGHDAGTAGRRSSPRGVRSEMLWGRWALRVHAAPPRVRRRGRCRSRARQGCAGQPQMVGGVGAARRCRVPPHPSAAPSRTPRRGSGGRCTAAPPTPGAERRGDDLADRAADGDEHERDHCRRGGFRTASA